MKTTIQNLFGSALLLAVLLGPGNSSNGGTPPPSTPPDAMALIPAGEFTMGDSFNDGSGNALPTHSVYVNAFYMDQFEVTKALWDEVYNWAISHGYSFDYVGSGKAADHPVQTVSWYDAVKWCNARSEKENRTPAYYTDAKLKTRYRRGQFAPYVKWTTGYRLPTEAEWEKAARGGASGRRFPWSDSDEVRHDLANYNSTTNRYGYETTYDLSATAGYHPAFDDGTFPYTSPAGVFAPNDYGLYDMAGNVFEWVWDWCCTAYPSGSAINPTGAVTGNFRIIRGGAWDHDAWWSRASQRSVCNGAGGRLGWNNVGFRSVLPVAQ